MNKNRCAELTNVHRFSFSAGCGRTGTFIAIDLCRRWLDDQVRRDQFRISSRTRHTSALDSLSPVTSGVLYQLVHPSLSSRIDTNGCKYRQSSPSNCTTKNFLSSRNNIFSSRKFFFSSFDDTKRLRCVKKQKGKAFAAILIWRRFSPLVVVSRRRSTDDSSKILKEILCRSASTSSD